MQILFSTRAHAPLLGLARERSFGLEGNPYHLPQKKKKEKREENLICSNLDSWRERAPSPPEPPDASAPPRNAGFGQMKVKSEDVPDSPADYTNSLSDDADGGLTSNGREHEVLPRGGGGGGDGGAPVLKKGPWTSAEDEVLKAYVKEHGPGNWNQVQRNSGLSRCGKSCRLRWTNHLRPDLKREPFSPDEKKLIMELHAKGGNKWAEMAALLPGRTDNEIKNYWNTRTKRLQRAGLPIYPENLLSQVSNEDQHSHIPGNGKKRLYDLSQGNDLDLDEVIFDNFNYEAQLSDISLCNLLGPNFVDPNYLSYPMNPPKRLAVSDSLMSGFDSSLSYEQFPHELENIPDSTDYDHIFFLNSGRINYLSVPFGSAIDGGDHQILNGNFSTSGPMPRPVKMELHSIQCTNNDPSNTWFDASSGSPIEQVDTFIQSPAASASVLSESFSPQNTVLLDALVHEGQGLGGHPKSQGSSKDSVPPVAYNQMLQHVQLNSSVEELRNNEVGYPVGYSSASVLAECAPGSSSFDEFQTSKSPSSLNTLLVAQKHHADTQLADGYRSFRPSPDALLESSLFYDDSEGSQDQSFDETLAALLHGDYFEEAYRHGLQQGLESLPWKNMPGACHTS